MDDETLPADLRRLQKIARLLDAQWRVPVLGWRFGLDPILGLIPGVGDAVAAAMGAAIVAYAVKHRVPTAVVARMVVNLVADLGVGALPVVGDVLDFAFKSNEKNLALLLEHRGRALPPPDDALPSPT